MERIQALYGVSIDEIVNFIGTIFEERCLINCLQRVRSLFLVEKTNCVARASPRYSQVKGENLRLLFGPLVYIGSGYFSWPISPIVITQPFWSGHLGIDVGTYKRQPIFASDRDRDFFWLDTTGFGNLVIIDHGNGYWSYYGHNFANLVREVKA